MTGPVQSQQSTGDRALLKQYTVAEFITYLHRVGYHDVADRVSRDRQIVVIGERVTHGRHCRCSSCAREDWTNPSLAPCGMHGPTCPPIYDPRGAPGEYAPAMTGERS